MAAVGFYGVSSTENPLLPEAEILEVAFLYWLTDYETALTRRWRNLHANEKDALARAQFTVFSKMLTEYIEYEAAKP